jgi:DNA repair photolyase
MAPGSGERGGIRRGVKGMIGQLIAAAGRCAGRVHPMSKAEQPSLFGPEGAGEDQPRVVRGVAVREVPCKSLLNRWSDGGYSFNCYTGCGHACVYCYARFMQRFHPHDEPWGRFVDVKVNAAEVLARQLRRLEPGSVFTCSACDGWQPIERRYKLTRRCCEMLLEAGFRLNVLTKSDLVLRDLELFAGREASVGVTITTPYEPQAKLWEPRASSVAARARVLREAKAAGLATSVMFGPLLPALSDTPEALRRLFAIAAEADVDRIWTDALNPRPRVWPSVQAMLRHHRPELLDLYRSVLFDRAFRARYVDGLHAEIRRAACEAGLADRLA